LIFATLILLIDTPLFQRLRYDTRLRSHDAAADAATFPDMLPLAYYAHDGYMPFMFTLDC